MNMSRADTRGKMMKTAVNDLPEGLRDRAERDVEGRVRPVPTPWRPDPETRIRRIR